jgi:hypothetical protein
VGTIVALDLIKSSLRLINAIAIGETPTGQEATDSLRVLNNLLETWSTENLTVYTQESLTFNFVPGQGSYTIGPAAADWIATRPVNIEIARTTYQGTNFPLQRIDEGWYNLIATTQQQSQIPVWFKYDADYPLGVVTMWPVPNFASTITLTVNKQFAEVPSTATVLSYPPGYERALRYSLAVDLGPEYGVLVPELVVAQARAAKAAIKRANNKSPVSRSDEALLGDQCYSIGQFLGGNF